MFDPLSFGLMAGGSALGGLLGGDQNEAAKRQYEALMALYSRMLRTEQAGYGQARLDFGKQLREIQQGYGNAQAQLSNYSTDAKQGAMDAEKSNLGALKASQISRGTYNTSAFDNLQRGVYADTQRRIGGIDSALAAARSNLDLGLGQAKAGYYGGLSQFGVNQANAMNNIRSQRAQAIQGVTNTPDQTAGILGGALGSIAGGGGFDWLSGLFGGGNSKQDLAAANQIGTQWGYSNMFGI